MRAIKLIRLIVISFVIFSCEEDEVKTSDVIQVKASQPESNADGVSTIVISGYIPIDAMPSKRTVTFQTTGGTLEDSVGNAQVKKISLKAVKKVGDFWVASTKYTSSLDPGNAVIYGSIEGFTDSVIVILKPVPPTGVSLSADAFAVAVNYLSEINLTAALSSSLGKVSKGYKVKFTDTYEDGSPVGGAFRNIQAASDGNSQAKATYSPGPVMPGGYILIHVIVLDATGAETNIKSSLRIYLKPE